VNFLQILICVSFFGLAGTGVAQTTLSGGISSAWNNTATISTTGGQTLTLGLGVEYLIVGGGGGGGGDNGGGGGGGGVLSASTTVNSQSYTFTVGSGGSGGSSDASGSSGASSFAFGFQAFGGGGGAGGFSGSSAGSGASGGGGDGEYGSNGGSGSSQGNSGGNGYNGFGSGGGGGGGGAGGFGASSTGNRGGNGGPGVANSITGSSITYGGGGGGGPHNDWNLMSSGGSGGGGYGYLGQGQSGTDGLGGGGGGAGWDGSSANGGRGGSGTVIVRFLAGDIASGGTESTINVSGTSYRLHQFSSSGTFAPTFAVADLQAVQSGVISGTGALTYNSAGKLILSANNTYSGGTTISAGTLQMGDGGTTGSLGSGNVNNIGILAFSRSDAVSVGNIISGSGGVTKLGTNSLTFTADNSYSGNTTVSGGTLIVASGASISSSATTVSTGAQLKVNGTAGAVNVNGTLSGSGTVGALTLNSGGTLAVGNSPGQLSAASAIWNGGSTFQFEITDAMGLAGTSWDLFAASGLLDLTTISAANKMNLTVLSTALQNYDVDTSYTWMFAKASSLNGTESWISDLDVTDRFVIDSAGFNGNTQPGRGFKVSTGTDGGFATLSLQAVPEPSSASLLVLGLAAVLARSRRCRI